MTQENFQQEVLQTLCELKQFTVRQEEVNKTLIESQDGLEKLIEHEVVERFAGMSDGTKAYTDQKIREHEASFHPRASAAQPNF